jgi:putative holliday junction resolvase
MKLIGVDYGRRRIGLAVTDETGTLVRGLATIDRKKCPDLTAALTAAIAAEQPQAMVFGLPLDVDDGETAMSAEVRAFAADFEKNACTRLPVHFVDESLTSIQAKELLRYKKKKIRRDKAMTDRIAACLILEAFLREQK